jgi:hypothetical protein
VFINLSTRDGAPAALVATDTATIRIDNFEFQSNASERTADDKYNSLSEGLGDLADELSPAHVHSPVDLAGLRSRVVFEDFHHQGRVVRDNDARLQHAQEASLPLGLAKCSGGVNRYIGVEPLPHGSDGRKSRADFERDAGEDQLLAFGRLDRASHTRVVEGIDR